MLWSDVSRLENHPADRSGGLPEEGLHPSCDPACAPHGTEDTDVGKTIDVDSSAPKSDSQDVDSDCDGFRVTFGSVPR